MPNFMKICQLLQKLLWEMDEHTNMKILLRLALLNKKNKLKTVQWKWCPMAWYAY